jgi:hypothetical protein
METVEAAREGIPVSCHEFLTYLYDRPETRELAQVLALAALRKPIEEAVTSSALRSVPQTAA